MSSVVLKAARDFLSDYDNWCSFGPRCTANGKTQLCIVMTVAGIEEQLWESNRANCGTAYGFLCRAAKEKIGIDYGISFYNDGTARWVGIPAKARWETLLKILDRAIELAKSYEESN